MNTETLCPEMLQKIDAYWRAANGNPQNKWSPTTASAERRICRVSFESAFTLETCISSSRRCEAQSAYILL